MTAPTPWPTVTCSSDMCGRPMIWGRLSVGAGKPHPFDAQPSPTGNIRLTARPGSRGPVGVILGGPDLAAARDAGEPLHTSHFATCAAAADFRTRRTR